MMKKALIISLMLMLMCGCGSDGEDEQTFPVLETVTFPPRTSSTYTGTTVDFIYAETQRTVRRPSANTFPAFPEMDMPEMPDFPTETADFYGENPFDEEFYAMFTAPETMPVFSSETTPTATGESFTEIEAHTATVTAVIEATEPIDETTVRTDSYQLPDVTWDTTDTTYSETMANIPIEQTEYIDTVTVESFDIDEFMPRPQDYPDFNEPFSD